MERTYHVVLLTTCYMPSQMIVASAYQRKAYILTCVVSINAVCAAKNNWRGTLL